MNGADGHVDDALVSLTSRDLADQSLGEQNAELRRRLADEHAQYRRKLQAYNDEQRRQAALVQKLQTKVTWHSLKCFSLSDKLISSFVAFLLLLLLLLLNKNIMSGVSLRTNC